jgi:hypothetical protein
MKQLTTQETTMRNGSYTQLSPETVIAKFPAARALLREARIDSTSRMRLADAALAASVHSDELMAVLEDRMRRAARRPASQPAHAERREEAFELV